MLILNCQSFTDDEIPDKLWQEAEYGINQQGNDVELETLLNYKILKNLEAMMQPEIRHFFELGRDQNVAPPAQQHGGNSLMNSANSHNTTTNVHYLDYGAASRHSSLAGLGNEDRMSTSSQRWGNALVPSNLRISKTREWMAEKQLDARSLLSLSETGHQGNQTVGLLF